jgi:NADH-quinone oxidoreductase subunit I
MAKIVKRSKLSFMETFYLLEIAKGMITTMRHMLTNLWRVENMQTMSYPEIQDHVPRNYRGKHRLMKRPDGEPRCVACEMCSTACPAHCIHIVAEPSIDSRIEKKPLQFEIDWLVCVFCGLCEEACPVDAIRMDTRNVAVVGYTRQIFQADMTTLLDWNPADYPAEDDQSQNAPGGSHNTEARQIWGLEVKQS